MVSKGSDRVVLWPRYFDAKLSRQAGRRVPESLAVRKPDASWIASAAKKLKISPEKDDDARDPRKPYEKCGRVLVKKQGSKEATIKMVAEQMSKGD